MITDIEVDVPVRVAYDQWTQFEDFPLFMDYVDTVEQIDDRNVRFKARIAGVTREWEAEITEQSPDQRIAWSATDGTANSGVVTFHPLTDDTTRVVLQLDVDAQGFLEKVADKGGFVSDRARKDLDAFKAFIEARGKPTGEFRGEFTRDPQRDRKESRAELEAMSRDDLYQLAQSQDVPNRSNMSKDELVDALGS